MTSSPSPTSSSTQGDATDVGTPKMLAEVRVPRETVNDDTVTIQTWHVAHGASVSAKQLVVSIETSKAVLEVESESAGFIEIVKAQGSEVPIGALIGRVLSSAPSAASTRTPHPPSSTNGVNGTYPTAPAVAGTSPTRSSNRLRDRMSSNGAVVAGMASGGTGVPPVTSPDSVNAARSPALSTRHDVPTLGSSSALPPVMSRKAQALIDAHHLDAGVFAGLGVVRENDVRRHLDDVAGSPAQPHQPAQDQSLSASSASTKAAPSIATSSGKTGHAPYVAHKKGLMGDAAASARDRGNRSVLWLIWNYLWRNWFLGNLVKVAPRGVILTLHKLRGVKMGHDVFIDPSATLETAYPENITIGNDVRITAGCVVMTHIKAPHYLRDSGLVPNVLRPVVFEDHCFIGVNSVVMPGVTVGRASVVASGSVVVTNVPAYSMVQGNPAKVIKTFDAGPQRTQR